MNYKNYNNLSTDILEGIAKIPSSIQLIVGIPRSGMVPAYMIGAQLNLPVTSLDAYMLGNFGAVGERLLSIDLHNIKHVLIVDDSIYSGIAITNAKTKLQSKSDEICYSFCAIYSSTEDNEFVDFYFKYLPTPRIFQWNYKNHFITTQSCYDIDGVLCIDPTDEENDDGINYRKFLSNAKPLFVPNYKISCLVTSRLTKYRAETEAWLHKHQIDYGELVMLNLPNAQIRRELKIHAKFKAEIFKHREEPYFVESNWEQAKTIFELVNKPVFCTENDVLIRSFSDIFFHESYSNTKERAFFENFYNRTSRLDLSNYKSILFNITPPILLKLILRLLKICNGIKKIQSNFYPYRKTGGTSIE